MYKCKKGMLTVTHPQKQHSNFIIIVIRVRWNSLSFLKMMKNCNHHHLVGMKGNCLHENFRFPQSLHFSKYSFFYEFHISRHSRQVQWQFLVLFIHKFQNEKHIVQHHYEGSTFLKKSCALQKNCNNLVLVLQKLFCQEN